MIPGKIKIMGIEYTVEEKDVVIIDGSTNYAGSVSYQHARIEILKEMSKERKEETLIHELLHAVLYESGISEQDEDLVNRASKVLYQVLKDNDLNFKN
jgi:Zn-dependent peptidase ImmA (M78 family)